MFKPVTNDRCTYAHTHTHIHALLRLFKGDNGAAEYYDVKVTVILFEWWMHIFTFSAQTLPELHAPVDMYARWDAAAKATRSTWIAAVHAATLGSPTTLERRCGKIKICMYLVF